MRAVSKGDNNKKIPHTGGTVLSEFVPLKLSGLTLDIENCTLFTLILVYVDWHDTLAMTTTPLA